MDSYYANVKSFGATGLATQFAVASAPSGGRTIEFNKAHDFQVGDGILIGKAGPLCTLAVPTQKPPTVYGPLPATPSVYRYQVATIDLFGGISAASPVQTVNGPATLLPKNYNTVSWDPVTGAYAYAIYGNSTTSYSTSYRSPTNGTTMSLLAVVPASKTSWNDIGYGSCHSFSTIGPALVSGTPPTAPQAQNIVTTVTETPSPTSVQIGATLIHSPVGFVQHDDTAAIQNAINSITGTGGSYSNLFFPPGNYMVSSQLTVDSFYLIGAGITATTLQCVAQLGWAVPFITLSNKANQIGKCMGILDMTITSYAAHWGNQIRDKMVDGIQTIDQAVLERVKVQAFDGGVQLYGSHVTIKDCVINECCYGIYDTLDQGDCLISNCVLTGQSWASIGIAPNAYLDGTVIEYTHLGFCPFGIYHEFQPANLTQSGGPMVGVRMLSSPFEAIFNGAIYEEAWENPAGGGIVDCIFDESTATYEGTSPMPNMPNDYTVQLGESHGVIHVLNSGEMPSMPRAKKGSWYSYNPAATWIGDFQYGDVIGSNGPVHASVFPENPTAHRTNGPNNGFFSVQFVTLPGGSLRYLIVWWYYYENSTGTAQVYQFPLTFTPIAKIGDSTNGGNGVPRVALSPTSISVNPGTTAKYNGYTVWLGTIS